MIKFIIGGRQVTPGNFGDAVMQFALEQIREHIQTAVGSIRDPDTGEFPTIVVRGNSLDDLKMHVEGSQEMIALVSERLGLTGSDEEEQEHDMAKEPKVFLSYTSDDAEQAGKIAEALMANGIDTWWDKWCIGAGDSLRQKIDQGLAECTHFLVLLTPQSIRKPWVNQEMDAGLVRKLNDECQFLPVRHGLPASELPPLLAGLHSPEVVDEEYIQQLVNDIHGVSLKPPLGPKPKHVANAAEAKTKYSPAATTVAGLFVEKTENGMFADPQYRLEALVQATGLTFPDLKDALFELSDFLKESHGTVLVQPSLFTEFDRYWKEWDAADDALRLAADIANDPAFPSACNEIADRYGWEPRRLNPAITYLLDRGMLADYKVLNSKPFVTAKVVGKEDPIRRFVKSRR
ncbi:toll/interleukin-1 receptor domain-containing protein [Marinobacterium sedimentorum]|uniref:toll/interleukin-1 receptor domain-containing protein n=1 Tax=Marinobacterium sedimentorum TaxID=2927804 RepID=UPI0020C64B9D|nr:toll/interleukin-1 receptor domain-containing protein [Marinobacterium sedimentorum]MCP8685960.1 toll/interleukin-1 receptor domain-containing protein [Marinobacterium sedimentorum]